MDVKSLWIGEGTTSQKTCASCEKSSTAPIASKNGGRVLMPRKSSAKKAPRLHGKQIDSDPAQPLACGG